MYSKVKVGGHPLHVMLVGFPITFYVLTFAGFIVYKFFSPDIFWYKLGYFSNYAAVISALVTAVPGMVDLFWGVPRYSEARKTGLIHMLLNLITVALFAANAIIISGNWETGFIPTGTNIFLSGLGIITVMAAGYFGWELVGRHKVGVELTPEQRRIEEDEEIHRDDGPVIFH